MATARGERVAAPGRQRLDNEGYFRQTRPSMAYSVAEVWRLGRGRTSVGQAER